MQPAEGPRCRHCWLPSPSPVCQDCLSKPLAVRELRSGFVYDGPARAAVLTLKHGGVVQLADELVELSGEILVAGDVEMVVPIPIPLLRRRRRGGNQAEHLARSVGARTGLPVEPGALRRNGWWGPATGAGEFEGRPIPDRARCVCSRFETGGWDAACCWLTTCRRRWRHCRRRRGRCWRRARRWSTPGLQLGPNEMTTQRKRGVLVVLSTIGR